MALKTWNSSYSVDVEALDKEHIAIFDMLNKLHDAMGRGESRSVMGQIITDMKNYAVQHFKNEEAYMESVGYPLLKEQQQQHRIFLNKATEFAQEFQKGNMTLATQMMPFLSD